jgi:hypothetical protein
LSFGILFAGLFVREYLTTEGPDRFWSFWYGTIFAGFVTQALYEQHGGARIFEPVLRPRAWIWLAFGVLFAVTMVEDFLGAEGPARYFSPLFGWVAAECFSLAWNQRRRGTRSEASASLPSAAAQGR